MLEKESIMVVWCELKIPSLGITFGITQQPSDAEQLSRAMEFSVCAKQQLKILIIMTIQCG